jgi:ankyrin repeat protein
MKKQNKFLHRTTIAFTFLTTVLLVTACNSNSQPNNAKSPQVDVHTAVATNNVQALKQYISTGANLNAKDPIGGSSPLITACLFGNAQMAKMLIDAGVDLNFKNKDCSTPLITAAFFCHPDIIRMLLDKRADKTIKNKYGQTAYETVAAPYADVKNVYQMLGKMLAPAGVKLDFAYIEKTRPQIAAMLK